MKFNRVHRIKSQNNYDFHENDTELSSFRAAFKLVASCAIIAVVCGITGIAGGMALGPLFLKYNMLPSVMTGTN